MSEDVVAELEAFANGDWRSGTVNGLAARAKDEIECLRAEVAWFEKRRGERLEFANEPAYGPWSIEEVEQLAASLHSEPCPLKRKAIRFTVRHLPNRDDWEWANRTAEYLNLGEK